MEEKKEDVPTVTLSPFRFTDWLKAPDTTTTDTGARNSEPKSSNFPGQSYWGPQLPPDYRRPEAYERMAADKPGEELAHDATIWKLYLEEAEEHDQELVKSRHGSLDMLLLFAALFSAILTAFLIESKDLLQRDPADASATLLLMVLQSQQRMELGLPSPVDTPLVDLPVFVPSASARWINGIWFTSLALSLSAALIAMLGKEWLTAYLASRPRPPRSHALLRQARLEGLEDWWALHIIALLPSLLHASLFLFSIGLVVYLQTLDVVVAGVLAGVIGITSLFYMVTAILGAIHEHCPFVTQVSGYIKRAFDRYLRPQLREDDRSNITSVKDLQALLWLANHARDPAVVDCSYHALAGLHRQVDPALPSNPRNTLANPDPISQTPSRLPMQINSDTTMLSLFYTLAERFRKLSTSPHVSSSSDGTNLTRYATALVWLFNHIKDFELDEAVDLGRNSEELSVSGGLAAGNQLVTPASRQTKPPSSEYILSLLDDIWSNNVAAFSADAYAGFLTVQMDLLNLAASFRPQSPSTPTRTPVGNPFSITQGLDTITRSAHVIDIVVANSSSPHHQRLTNLRANYSRTLCRISCLLLLQSERKIQLDSSSLVRLLDSVRTLAGCEELNPLDSISTHHPQYNTGVSPSFSMELSVMNADKWSVIADNLYHGPLGVLIGILRLKPDVVEESLLRTRISALEAFSVLAPVLLQQVFQIDRAELHKEFNFHTWRDLPTLGMQGVRYVAVRQMFLVLRYVAPRMMAAGTLDLCLSALDLITDSIAEGGDGADAGAYDALEDYGGDLAPLLERVGVIDSRLETILRRICHHSIDLAKIRNLSGIAICQTSLSPNCFPVLIRMIPYSDISTDGIRRMLQSIVSRIRNGPTGPHPSTTPWDKTPSVDYLDCFTHTDKGFSAFLFAAADNDYLEVVVDATSEIVHLAANRHEVLKGAPIELRTPAVPGFLELLTVVVKHYSSDSEHQQSLLDFSQDVMRLLEVASEDSESHELIAQHKAFTNLYTALKGKNGDLTSLHQMEKLGSKLGIKINGQDNSIAKPGTRQSDVNPEANVTASDDEGSEWSTSDGIILSANEEGNPAQ